MLNTSKVKKGIYDWVTGVSKLSAIWEDQNAPAPAGNYISLRLSNFVSVGLDTWAPVSDTGMSRIISDKMVELRIRCFSPEAMAVLEEVSMYSKFPEYQQILQTAGVTILQKGNVENISGLNEHNRMEEKAVLDIRLLTTIISEPVDLSTIEGAEVTGTKMVGNTVVKIVVIKHIGVRGQINIEHILNGEINTDPE